MSSAQYLSLAEAVRLAAVDADVAYVVAGTLERGMDRVRAMIQGRHSALRQSNTVQFDGAGRIVIVSPSSSIVDLNDQDRIVRGVTNDHVCVLWSTMEGIRR